MHNAQSLFATMVYMRRATHGPESCELIYTALAVELVCLATSSAVIAEHCCVRMRPWLVVMLMMKMTLTRRQSVAILGGLSLVNLSGPPRKRVRCDICIQLCAPPSSKWRGKAAMSTPDGRSVVAANLDLKALTSTTVSSKLAMAGR